MEDRMDMMLSVTILIVVEESYIEMEVTMVRIVSRRRRGGVIAFHEHSFQEARKMRIENVYRNERNGGRHISILAVDIGVIVL
mmetsp:Transcript_54182/g.65374  ORF Transcript_54182/g.65374 Transcript_54182/m.65374 type:complete len:83 (-) Transcript_54182:58-306(-)